MQRFIPAAVICALLVSMARAQDASSLTAEQVKAIIAKPHDDKPSLKGLEILPTIRTWKAEGAFINADGERMPFKAKTAGKRVDGKYDVSEITIEAPPVSFTMVTTWDEKSGMYYKYVLPPEGPMSRSIGMRVPATRSIAWAAIGEGPESISVETYDDKKMSWRSLMVNPDGAVVLAIEGAAMAEEK